MNSLLECIDESPRELLTGLSACWESVDSPPTEEPSTARHHALHRRAALAREFAALRLPVEPDIRVTVPAADEEALALGNMDLIRSMRSLVQWAEPGRPVTQTGAMRRGDTTAWMRHFGLRVPGGWHPPSMRDIRGIGQPWDIAVETGMLSVTTTKVRPGPTGTVFESGDPVAQVLLGRSIVNLLLLQALSRPPAVQDGRSQIGIIMLRLFALLLRPDGHDLGDLRDIATRLPDALRDGDPTEQSTALACSATLREMRMLCQFGLVTDVDGIAGVPAALRPAVVASINGPWARPAVDHDALAVPVVTDE